jgi:hypothetical protein
LPKYEFQSITAEGGATIVNDNNEKLTASYNEEVGQNISLNDNNNLKAFPSDIDMSTLTSCSEIVSDVYKVSRSMENEFTAIRAAFGTMCARIRELLMKYEVSLDNLKAFCRFTFNLSSHQMINECQTLEDVMAFISNKCTLINITFLEGLVEYCEIENAAVHILKYKESLKSFKQKIRMQFPLHQSLLPRGSPPPLIGETITFKMTWDPKDRISLDDITALLTDAFEELCTSVNVLEVKPSNSVDIICSFSSELTGLLIYHAVKNLKILKKKGLLELTIGYCTIWKRSDEVE